jgi:hypothetical protein
MRTSQEKIRQKSRGNSSKDSAAGGSFQQQVGAGSPCGRWICCWSKLAREGSFQATTREEERGSVLQEGKSRIKKLYMWQKQP